MRAMREGGAPPSPLSLVRPARLPGVFVHLERERTAPLCVRLMGRARPGRLSRGREALGGAMTRAEAVAYLRRFLDDAHPSWHCREAIETLLKPDPDVRRLRAALRAAGNAYEGAYPSDLHIVNTASTLARLRAEVNALRARLSAATYVYRAEFAFDCDVGDSCDCRTCRLAVALAPRPKRKVRK